MKTVLLVDADYVVYSLSCALEQNVRWPNGIWTKFAGEDEADVELERYFAKMVRETGADEVVVCFSDMNGNYRKDFFPGYKGNRSTEEGDKYLPVIYYYMKGWLNSKYESVTREKLEADDCIGILMTKESYYRGWKKVMASVDKDFRTIPNAWFFDLGNRDKGLQWISREDADAFFYKQVLMGDNVDGIPGCPGIGAKTADKVLKGKRSSTAIWTAIVEQYAKKALDEDYAILNARLVRILRSEDYDFNNKCPILWEPEKRVEVKDETDIH